MTITNQFPVFEFTGDEAFTDEEFFQEVADQILDTLLCLQEQNGMPLSEEAPTIKLFTPDTLSDSDHGSLSAMDEFLLRLEVYIQEQIDAWYKPTILH